MKNVKTILFASLIVAMILPFSGMNFANADNQNIEITDKISVNDSATVEKQTEDKIIKLAERAAKLQNKINEGIKVDVNQMKLDRVLDRLNSMGITMEGQDLDVLSEFHSDGIDDTDIEFEIMCTECEHSIKVKAAYQYFKYTLFGINFYGNVSGSWSPDMYVTADKKDVLVSIDNGHAASGPIWGYSVTASNDRPTTAVYDTFVNAIDSSGVYQFPNGDFTTYNNQASFTWSWDTHNSPLSPGFYAGTDWDLTARGEVVTLS